MIIPIPLIGLAFAGSKLLPKLNRRPNSRRTRATPRPRPRKRLSVRFTSSSLHRNPMITPVPQLLQNLMRGLSTSISKLAQKSQKEDYTAIVKGFMPKNAQLLTPQGPVQMGRIQFADLDGDSQNELITSYKGNDGVRTLVLKKHGERWGKISEIYNPHFDSIQHLSFSNIIGDGKKQLLLGGKTKGGLGELRGYSFQNDRTYELFAQRYNHLEIVEPTGSKEPHSKSQLALWKIPGDNIHTIDIMEWNGSGLTAVQNPSSYYRSRVIPYYAKKVKQTPQSPTHWYYLADALQKSGMYRDGITAIDMGMRLSPVFPSMDTFAALKKDILSKMG